MRIVQKIHEQNKEKITVKCSVQSLRLPVKKYGMKSSQHHPSQELRFVATIHKTPL